MDGFPLAAGIQLFSAHTDILVSNSKISKTVWESVSFCSVTYTLIASNLPPIASLGCSELHVCSGIVQLHL